MRVVAGSAKGRRLLSVPGEATRPIADRVKVALFDTLADFVKDARVLDLFGGTGSVGIEALSRGAAEAVFVERSREAVGVLRENLRLTRLEGRATVVQGDAFAYLGRPDVGPFDLIYIAPPQYQGLWLKALQVIDRRSALLYPEGLAIVQIHPKEAAMPELAMLRVFDERRYGSTLLVYYERVDAPE